MSTRWLPFEEAKKKVQALGLKSTEEWKEWRKSSRRARLVYFNIASNWKTGDVGGVADRSGRRSYSTAVTCVIQPWCCCASGARRRPTRSS